MVNFPKGNTVMPRSGWVREHKPMYPTPEQWYNAQVEYLRKIKVNEEHYLRYLSGLEYLYGQSFVNQIEKEVSL